MGVVASKGDNNTPLVNLCKERKDLIKAARDARYHLAKSHLLYFQSLLDFSKTLNQFVHEDLIVVSYSSDDDSSSSDLICCGSDSDSDSDSDCLVCDRSRTGPLNNRVEKSPTREHVPLSKDDQHPYKPVSENKQTCGSSNTVDDHPSREDLVEKEFMSAPVEDVERGSDENSSFMQQTRIPDFIGLYPVPFSTQCGLTEPNQRDEVESDVLREIREREGIPDLESDSDHNNLIRKNQKKKKNVKQGSSSSSIATPAGEVDQNQKKKKKNGKESSSSPSTATPSGKVDKKDVKFNIVQESSSAANLVGGVDKSNVEADTCDVKVEGEDDKRTETSAEGTRETPRKLDDEVCDEAYESSSSSSSSSSESSNSGTTDLRSIVERINGRCQKVVSIKKEVSELLEVSKVVHHQPLGDQFKGFASRMLGSSGNSTRSLLSTRGLREENSSGSISMTLEKLYTWEKKLYAEVIIEERLRVLYDKGYKILKNLDQTGAESSKIYEAEAAVKYHLSNINVSLRTVESISMRVHSIRDEELLFQVNGIINGFKEMWRLLAKCHHKQFRAISRSKSCVHIVENGSSSRKATHKVEEQIRKYRESLRGYIDAYRGFVDLLNDWLNRNIMEEDDTEIEAPAIFRVCSEWLRGIASVDEVKLLSAVEEMELRFRGLGFKQAEEEKQRVRTERLSKEMEEILETGASDSMRELVTQEREKHERLIRELNDTVSTCLQECLVPVFEALEEFCFGNFKACQNIRIVSIETLLL